jgi:uncharacterized protein (TIGR00255 family)
MTGFASRESVVEGLGKVSFEIRSTNHKFLETVLHLPAGFLSLEDKVKKQIEGSVKRGRVVCVMNILGAPANDIFVDRRLLKKYTVTLKEIQKEARIKEGVTLDTLIHLPGVLSLAEEKRAKSRVWPQLNKLLIRALEDLAAMREKEGRALYVYFMKSARSLQESLSAVTARFRKAVKSRMAELGTPEERSGFLKSSDITEEIERLAFHAKNFKEKLSNRGAIGKELDFIAQEMQREANTMGAKSFDAAVSAMVVQMKSQIEKIREQLQNIE